MTRNHFCWLQTARRLLNTLSTKPRCGTRWLVKLMFGKNPIYRHVKRGEEEIYQSYFTKIVNSVDVSNLTARSCCKLFDDESACRDLNTIDHVVDQAKSEHSLCPVIIETMLWQYVYADPLLREKDKYRWIYEVMARDDRAYFPDAISIYNTIYNC